MPNANTPFYNATMASSRALPGYTTAVNAALWYSKYLAGIDPTLPNGSKCRLGESTPPQPAAAARQEGGGAHSNGGAASAPPPVLALADAIDPYVSPPNFATGCRSVVARGPCFDIYSKCFLESPRDDGRPRSQRLASAQEAPVAYARRVAAARSGPLQQHTGSDTDAYDEEMRDVPNGTDVKAAVGPMIISHLPFE